MTREWLGDLADRTPWYGIVKTKYNEFIAAGLTPREALEEAAAYGREILEEVKRDIAEIHKL